MAAKRRGQEAQILVKSRCLKREPFDLGHVDEQKAAGFHEACGFDLVAQSEMRD